MHGNGIMFDSIFKFEQALAKHTGAPYAVMTDCCTHAIEMCLRYDRVKYCEFTAYTYLSICMTMHKLDIGYDLTNETWTGEYQFHRTRIWDSARFLAPNMYRPQQMQCLSFGYDKPLSIGRGGAILLDDEAAYKVLSRQRSDGRDLRISPWETQSDFQVGYHYRPTIEESQHAFEMLPAVNPVPNYKKYPDLRKIHITH